MNMVIDESTAKKRADVLLANHYTQYSRAALGKLFDMDCIKLDGQPIRRGDKPKLGQVLTADISPIQQEPDVVDLPVLYEDGDVIVIDKPAGIISHSRGRYWQEASVASFIRDKTKDMTGDRAGIVHRLDRATSGVMIAAKTEAAQAYLQKQFAERSVQKQYIALVAGTPAQVTARIEAPLLRNPSNPKQFMVDVTGKNAITTYRVEQSVGGISKVILTPLTGRTHQLRVHMQYIKHPILGDDLYSLQSHKESRLYLHAYSLTIHIPSGELKTFIAPLPKEFLARLKI
jgi:23S rRNA pseudouridine1911/1915/1917 synthase